MWAVFNTVVRSSFITESFPYCLDTEQIAFEQQFNHQKGYAETNSKRHLEFLARWVRFNAYQASAIFF